MKSATVTNLIATTSVNLQNATAHLEMITTTKALSGCPYVCIFESGLTVSADDEGVPYITAKTFTSQFTPETAAEICSNVKDGNGNSPKMISDVEYYTFKVNDLKATLEIINTLN